MARITPLDGSETDFDEFPTTEALSDFDVADRKFIAVAIAYERDHNKKATILQALDRKWGPFREAFEREGLQIDFLCPFENTAPISLCTVTETMGWNILRLKCACFRF